jgi:hypothetical protein
MFLNGHDLAQGGVVAFGEFAVPLIHRNNLALPSKATLQRIVATRLSGHVGLATGDQPGGHGQKE